MEEEIRRKEGSGVLEASVATSLVRRPLDRAAAARGSTNFGYLETVLCPAAATQTLPLSQQQVQQQQQQRLQVEGRKRLRRREGA